MKLGKINRQSIAISGFTSVLGHYNAMPSSLFFRGTLPKERRPTVAVIGSRKPTPYGVEVTRQFASSLAKRGVVIISGLAYGVDSIAHEACLDIGGTTIAVMANGLHTVYPKRHLQLAHRIVKEGGAIVSEYAAGVEPRPYYFLARNRIVSGLADAVLVTEATDKSGTFSTVAHAISQNKEVFAVPGPVTSLLSAGPNRLLQTGAHIACEPDDILRIIAPNLLLQSAPAQTTLLHLPPYSSSLEETILHSIQQGERDGEELQKIAHSKLSCETSEFLQALSLLELHGTIRCLGGNQWTLS